MSRSTGAPHSSRIFSRTMAASITMAPGFSISAVTVFLKGGAATSTSALDAMAFLSRASER